MRLRSMGRPVVRSLVVRIYRSSPDKPDCLLGEAEEVGKKGVRSFRNLEELWAIVNPRKGKKPGVSGKEEVPDKTPSGT
jgi:hypothetical protein